MKGDITMDEFMNVVKEALKGFFADFIEMLAEHLNGIFEIEMF